MDFVREMIESVVHKVVLMFVNTASAAGEPTSQTKLRWTVLKLAEPPRSRSTLEAASRSGSAVLPISDDHHRHSSTGCQWII
jgi:hypothetical protein